MFLVRPSGQLVYCLVLDVPTGGCGTFYAISISSEAFKGLPTVKQHRLVNETLKREIEGIHGLQVSRVWMFYFDLRLTLRAQLRTSVPPST